MSLDETLGKVKAKLVLEQAFFASMICRLPISADPTIPTFATNGQWVKYNPEFGASLTFEELLFVLCHEVGHCIFQHMFRRGGRNPRRWNRSGDYIINHMLVEAKIGTMPTCALYNAALVQQGGGTTEGVYEILPEDDGDGANPDGTDLDVCEDAQGSEADVSQASAEMKVMIAQAAQAARMCGQMPGALSKFVESALQSKVNYVDVMRRFMSTKAKVDYTYARPKRRFSGEDFYLPSLSGERLGHVIFAIDCSGSCWGDLPDFRSEVQKLCDDCHPERVHTLYFDTEVSHHDEFDPDDDIHMEAHGGGGTAFSPIFRYIEDHGIEAACIVVLTDLCAYDFGPEPAIPVLWVTNGGTTAPWGEVVEMHPKL